MIYGIPPLVNVEREMSSAILKTKLNKLLPKRQDVVLIKGYYQSMHVYTLTATCVYHHRI